MNSLLKITAFALSTFLTIGQQALAGPAAGPANGGGGYALACPERGVDAYYSYDYKMTESPNYPVDPQIANAPSAKVILDIIQSRLVNKLPLMAESLKDFAQLNRNEFDEKQRRLWTFGMAHHPLINIHNEAKLREIQECRPQAIQAVIRTTPGQITYDADQSVLDRLNATSPVQLSFLLVHEWLRDYTEDPVILAKVTRLLHQADWANVSGDALKRALLNRGLTDVGPSTDEMAGQKRYEVCMADQKALRSKLEAISRKIERMDSARVAYIVYANDGGKYIGNANASIAELHSEKEKLERQLTTCK